MSHLYKKRDPFLIRTIIRYAGLTISITGLLCLLYILYPFISWKFYFEPVFASNDLETPIPKTAVLSKSNMHSLFSSAVDSLSIDYSDAMNWFPHFKPAFELKNDPAVITTFNISIPKLRINYANVSTIDTDLSKHLILYPGTSIPPETGNSVIFGHSTIPTWFNPHDYKTIFGTVHTLKTGDQIVATVNTKEYVYIVESIRVTTPEDMSIFTQDNNGSYLTLLTCTPPGTTWKRLLVKAKLQS
jgi:sortase A